MLLETVSETTYSSSLHAPEQEGGGKGASSGSQGPSSALTHLSPATWPRSSSLKAVLSAWNPGPDTGPVPSRSEHQNQHHST